MRRWLTMSAVVLWVWASSGARAYTLTTDLADCDEVTIASAEASAVDGDTLVCPPGTSNWGTMLSLTKAITLQGAGVGQTIIIDDVNNTDLLRMTVVSGKTSRITGLEFQDGARICSGVTCHGIVFLGTNTTTPSTGRFRFDHNKIDHLQVSFMMRVGAAFGVVDNNTILTASNRYPFYTYTPSSYSFVDGRWAAGPLWGSEEAVFFEDNVVTYDVGSAAPCMDSYGGARVVVRYNAFTRCYIEAHGTESAGRARGTMSLEVYNNTFTGDGVVSSGELVHLRSGTALVYNNTAVGHGVTPRAIRLNNERTYSIFSPWGIVDGRNNWDVNDPGNPFETGTTSSAGTRTVTDSSKSWTINQWAGYTIRKLSAPCNRPITAVDAATDRLTVPGHGLATGNTIHVTSHVGSTPHLMSAYVVTVIDADTITLTNATTLPGGNITVAGSGGYVSRVGGSSTSGGAVSVCAANVLSNTSTQITFSDDGAFTTLDLAFAAGETFELNKVTEVLDAPGRSGGTTLGGVEHVRVPSGWNDQVDAPIYEWNNTEDGADIDISNGFTIQIREGEHYFNDTELVYTPYTYPHPLRDDSEPDPPADPTGRARLGRRVRGDEQ
jgi:hypothetical protein